MEQLAARLRSALPPLPAPPADSPALLAEAEPLAFWSHLLLKISSARTVALADPAWPPAWQQAMAEIAGGASCTGSVRILIPTGGSSGLPRFCIHDLDTLMSAAHAFAIRFGRTGIVHAVSVLPQHHVGGLMPVFRSAACAGRLHFADYRDADSIKTAPFPLQEASLSLVPTQLGRMLESPRLLKVLQAFGLILVGGASCPPHLLEAARRNQLRLSPCYGSTETAAMVTALDPDEFLRGITGVGTVLPHARIEIDPNQRISVSASSNLRAYLPEQANFSRDPFLTSDLGFLDGQGQLHILGRADRIIITGGEKVHPEQVEAAALASGLVRDVRCEGSPDPDWGSRVILHAVATDKEPLADPSTLIEVLQKKLPAYAVPKAVIFHEHLPRSSIGKWLGNA